MFYFRASMPLRCVVILLSQDGYRCFCWESSHMSSSKDGQLVSLPHWCRLKYLNNYWIDQFCKDSPHWNLLTFPVTETNVCGFWGKWSPEFHREPYIFNYPYFGLWQNICKTIDISINQHIGKHVNMVCVSILACISTLAFSLEHCASVHPCGATSLATGSCF